MFFDPMEDKVYRHPTFYELPESRGPHVNAHAARQLASTTSSHAAPVQYLLRLGDTCLIHASAWPNGAATRRSSRRTSR